MRLVDFEISHFDRLDIKDSENRAYRERYREYANHGPAFTMLDAMGEPLACGGIFVHWQGVGEIWMLSSRGLAEYPVSTVRVGRHVMDCALGSLNLHRIQATVECGDIKGRNYVEMFGFCFEGLLRKYSPNGEDYLLYSRIK